MIHGPKPIYWFLFFTLLFSVQVIPRLSQDSPVGDEVADIADGYYYWSGDLSFDLVHPPLAKALQALPLRAMGLRSDYAGKLTRVPDRDEYFLAVLNPEKIDTILFVSRFVTFLFGLGLGALLFAASRGESTVFRITVLALWAFEPCLLAFSGFALSDMPFTFFFFLTVWTFQKTLGKASGKGSFWVGLWLGMTIMVKFTGLLLLPILLVLELSKWKGSQEQRLGSLIRRWGSLFISAGLFILLAYLPGTLATKGHPFPLRFFIQGLTSLHGDLAKAYYFRGVLTDKTFWDYYPTAFLLKSPLSFLALLTLGLFGVGLRKVRWPFWQWVPVVIFILPFFFYYDIGLRMILPIYPFCLLMAAKTSDWLISSGQRAMFWVWGALLLFQALSVGLQFPRQVSYFNEAVAPEKRLYWLGDSNLDCGQDTQRMADVVKARGWRHVKLAYFGSLDPHLYGMDWAYWTERDLKGPQPGWVYLINAAYIQLEPAYSPVAKKIDQSWITHRDPTGTVGDTWFYFEIPGEVQKDDSPIIASAPLFTNLRYSKPR